LAQDIGFTPFATECKRLNYGQRAATSHSEPGKKMKNFQFGKMSQNVARGGSVMLASAPSWLNEQKENYFLGPFTF
jgi:hypothetical protein